MDLEDKYDLRGFTPDYVYTDELADIKERDWEKIRPLMKKSIAKFDHGITTTASVKSDKGVPPVLDAERLKSMMEELKDLKYHTKTDILHKPEAKWWVEEDEIPASSFKMPSLPISAIKYPDEEAAAASATASAATASAAAASAAAASAPPPWKGGGSVASPSKDRELKSKNEGAIEALKMLEEVATSGSLSPEGIRSMIEAMSKTTDATGETADALKTLSKRLQSVDELVDFLGEDEDNEERRKYYDGDKETGIF